MNVIIDQKSTEHNRIESLSDIKKIAVIYIDKNDINNLKTKLLQKYAKNAKMDGFRAGHIPLNIVEKMYGLQAYEEAISKKINDKFFNIIKENNLYLAGEPIFTLKNNDIYKNIDSDKNDNNKLNNVTPNLTTLESNSNHYELDGFIQIETKAANSTGNNNPESSQQEIKTHNHDHSHTHDHECNDPTHNHHHDAIDNNTYGINADDYINYFVFIVKFEIFPTIIINDLSDKICIKPHCNITEEDVDHNILQLRNKLAKYILATDENQIVKDGDQVIVDYIGLIDNKEFDDNSDNDFEFIVGDHNSIYPEFNDAILGMVIHQTKEVLVDLSVDPKEDSNSNSASNDDTNNDNASNKNAIFKLTLKSIKTKELPEIDDKFMEYYGITDHSIDTLRQQVRNTSLLEVSNLINQKTKENLYELLLQNHEFEAPQAIVNEEINDMMNKLQNEFMEKYNYNKIDDLDTFKELAHELFSKAAIRKVKIQLLLERLIKDNQISVNQEEINDTIDNMSLLYNNPQNFIKLCQKDGEHKEKMKLIAIENKLVSLLLSKVKLEKQEITYAALAAK